MRIPANWPLIPAIAALALFAFVYHWNTYLWPLTVLQGNTDDYPIVLSLGRLLSYNRGAMNTNLVMAGATLAVLPPLVLFVFLQRFFVDSIVSSDCHCATPASMASALSRIQCMFASSSADQGR